MSQSANRSYTILVTGVGAIIGYGIIESLRIADPNCRIIGTDIYLENYGRYLCDNFIQVPLTSHADYGKTIAQIVLDYGVDLVIPGIEQDLFYFNSNRGQTGAQVVLNSQELIDLSRDKWLFYNHLQKCGYSDSIPTKIGLTFDEAVACFGLPFLIKPRVSYASKGLRIISSQAEFETELKLPANQMLFQPVIGTDDQEFTISGFGDGKGSLLDSFGLRRSLSSAGASEKAFTIGDDKALLRSIDKLVEIFKPIGPTNFQFRKNLEQVYLLEVNPRHSSACSIRTKFGYNEPGHCLNFYLAGKPLNVCNKKSGKAIRYIGDLIRFD